MKITFTKSHGGVLIPANDIESERMSRFKTGEQYEIDIKLSRNPAFHRKVFAFFNFCFEHWRSCNECTTELAQREVFRNHLTVLAGYFDTSVSIKGGVRITAKSLAYAGMNQEEFEQCYIALTNAAMKHIFKTADQQIYNQLISFF